MTGSSVGPFSVNILSTSTADDLGLIALVDVARAAEGLQYRVIGGHMVRLLTHVYGSTAELRLTVDADAGVPEQVAVGGEIVDALCAFGYRAFNSNRFVRDVDGLGEVAVDILVPTAYPPEPQTLGGRQFDAAPGLRFALSATGIRCAIRATLTTGEVLECECEVADLEAAVVLKLLATRVRHARKDLIDLMTLLEIVQSGVGPHSGSWRLSQVEAVRGGERCDAARAAATLRGALRSRVEPRLAALLARWVADPPR